MHYTFPSLDLSSYSTDKQAFKKEGIQYNSAEDIYITFTVSSDQSLQSLYL